MSHAIQIAERYFDLSNISDLESIRKMFSDSSTYSSVATGIYLGRDSIMDMMAGFHELRWTINIIRELQPGVVEIDFVFNGMTKDGKSVQRTGREYLIVVGDRLQHIEVLSA